MQVDIYFLSTKTDRLYVMTAAILARLMGITINFHDYRFLSDRGGRLTRVIRSLSRTMEVGDISAIVEDEQVSSDLLYRCEAINCDIYGGFRKSRAVPRVLVYGDFQSARIRSLINRTHDLVKQKYPRTEFVLLTLTSQLERRFDTGEFESSVSIATVVSETQLQDQFRDCDMVMLLSPGSLNRLFVVRAQSVGYPVVVNGFDYPRPGRPTLNVPRDSYSGLAEAIIRLVDDDDYYQSFGSN
jgi:hypothetical protein